MKKDFITTSAYTESQLKEMIDTAITYKAGQNLPNLNGQIINLIFANPSLRTRLSFESGMKKLGGFVNILNAQDSWNFEYQDDVVMNSNKQEHIKEMAQVLAQYADVIAIRNSSLMSKGTIDSVTLSYEDYKKDLPINALAKKCPKPVINMESNMYHPCQSMADAMTMAEQFGDLTNKKYVLSWAPHPKPLPLATPHSQLITPSIFGMDVTLACPEGFELDEDVMEFARSKASSFKIEHNQAKAFKDADVVMAKSWISTKYFHDLDAEKSHRAKFLDWTIDEEKMSQTNDAFFMHCLPIRRGVVASDAVIEGRKSLIIDQAANRMWAQMAIINYLLN